MEIFKILKNLYTNTSSKWIKEVENEDIQPMIIQRWLGMNDAVRQHVRWLDKYTFKLPPKMYLSLAWSVLPKSNKTPFVKYISDRDEKDKVDEYDFILQRIRKHMGLGDNDFIKLRGILVDEIKKCPAKWFSFYGVEKRYWNKHCVDYNQIKLYGVKKSGGLEKWTKGKL